MRLSRQFQATVCSCHVTYAFQSESTLYSCLNVKELFARSRLEIWSSSDCNWTRPRTTLFESSCSHLDFKPVYFFLRKDFDRTKTQIKPKPTNKNTNKRIKNSKGNNFSRIKTSKWVKIGYFALWCFLYAQNLFVKKKLA